MVGAKPGLACRSLWARTVTWSLSYEYTRVDQKVMTHIFFSRKLLTQDVWNSRTVQLDVSFTHVIFPHNLHLRLPALRQRETRACMPSLYQLVSRSRSHVREDMATRTGAQPYETRGKIIALYILIIWLRYCATNRKVAGSIPDCVVGIFHWHNPSYRTMALGSTQPLTEMSTRSISWG
jgi:hypothetical protein